MSGEGHLAPSERFARHADFCGWHVDQRPSECSCGDIAPVPGGDDGHSYSNGNGGRIGNWMQTFSGRQFWPLDPRPEEVHIEDIAHALANACRFAGHCDRFYSVAEHSLLVSRIVPPELALAGLLHDASEAYVVDIPRPLKPYLVGYKAIEMGVWHAIADRFEISRALPQAIKDADNAVLLAEAEELMKPHPAPWCVPGEPAAVPILGLAPERAEEYFLARFEQLAGGHTLQ